MDKKKKVTIQTCQKSNYRWAYQTFILAICMSLVFGFMSQTILTSMGAIMAVIGISIFIFLSVIFDMVGIAVTSADEEVMEKWNKEKVKGSELGLKLCRNSEKVCSFCADVVGDICSTLCGAGGACIVVAITEAFHNDSLIMLFSISVSALIAGLTIFFKALMKSKAIKNANYIILKIGTILEKTLFRKRKNKK